MYHDRGFAGLPYDRQAKTVPGLNLVAGLIGPTSQPKETTTMAANITTDADFAKAVAQLIHDGQNGNLDKDKAKKLQAYLIAAPNKTVTAAIVAVQGNH